MNPHTEVLVPKTSASANSATSAYLIDNVYINIFLILCQVNFKNFHKIPLLSLINSYPPLFSLGLHVLQLNIFHLIYLSLSLVYCNFMALKCRHIAIYVYSKGNLVSIPNWCCIKVLYSLYFLMFLNYLHYFFFACNTNRFIH